MFENSLLQENLEMHFWIKFKPSTSYIVSKQKIPHSTVFMEVIFFNCYVTQIRSKYPCRYRRYAAAVRVSRHNRPSVFASSYSVHFISIASQVIVISDSIVLFSSALASVEARPCAHFSGSVSWQDEKVCNVSCNLERVQSVYTAWSRSLFWALYTFFYNSERKSSICACFRLLH